MRRGFTIVELAIASGIMVLFVGLMAGAGSLLNRQNRVTSDTASQLRIATLWLDTVHEELSAAVLNPLPNAQQLEGNSFLISRPNATSIQFVTRKRERESGIVRRVLVDYEALPRRRPRRADWGETEDSFRITLRKYVRDFTRDTNWTERVEDGWLLAWTPQVLEDSRDRLAELDIADLQWEFQPAGRYQVNFRLKVVLKVGRNRFLPLSTLVSVPYAPVESEANTGEDAV